MKRDSEWGGTRMKDGAVSIVKFKNLVKRNGFEVVDGHNVRINGLCVGCGGFLKKKDGDDRLVYFNTDSLGNKVLYRTAQNTKDYTGGINCYATFDANLIAGLDRLYKIGDWSKRW